jgi:hypothetical protein
VNGRTKSQIAPDGWRQPSVQLGHLRLHCDRRTDRTHRVVLVRGWRTEHADDGVADELLDGPPCRSISCAIASKYGW